MPDYLLVLILGFFAATLLVLGVWIVFRFQRHPRDKEKRRRLAVNMHGRLADGTITETTDNAIFYSYSVGGVIYAASQDLSELQKTAPLSLEQFVGCPVTVKYATRNPANSIVICEEWSGLRTGTIGGTA